MFGKSYVLIACLLLLSLKIRKCKNRKPVQVLDETFYELLDIRGIHLFVRFYNNNNSQNLRSTINQRLQKYTDLKNELIRIWQRKRPI